jgi:hypothetical protein
MNCFVPRQHTLEVCMLVYAKDTYRYTIWEHAGAAIRDVLKPLAVGDLSLRLYPTICTTQLV